MNNLTWNSTATKAGTATGSSSSYPDSSRLTKDGTNVDEYLEAYKAKRAQKETVSENSRLTKDGTNVDSYFEEYKARRGARDTEAILSEYESLAKKYNDSIAGAQAYTSGGWKDASSGEAILKTYEELKSGVDSLNRRTSGNEGVKNTLGHGRYYELLREVESMGTSVDSALGAVKSASESYGRYDSADAYNRAMKLQGMSRETLQSEVDRLSGEMEALLSNPDYKIKSFVSAGPRSGQPLPEGVQSSRNGVAQLTLDGMQKYKELEDQRVEYQTMLNEREYADNAEKYNADPRSLGYSDLMKLLKTAEQEKESNPGRYEFVKSYYDGLSESELYDLQGLDKITRLSKAERAKLDKIYELAVALESAVMATGSRFSAEYHMKKKLVENGMDEEEAESLSNHYIRYQNALKRQASQQEYAERIQSSTGDAYRLNLLTLPANFIGGISSVLGNVSQYISNEISGKDIPLDPNAGYNKYTNFTSDVRSITQAEIEKAADFEIAGVNVAGTLYNTVMSGIDSGLAILAGGAIGSMLSGGGAAASGVSSAMVKKAASATSGLIMGSNAAGQEIIQSLEKGDSNTKAIARGIGVGLVETLTEKFGVDALFDIAHGKGGVIKKALQSFASEGTEEVISNWGTSLVDKLSGEGFRFESLMKQYMEQGYSQSTAAQKAGADILTEDAVTFIAGGLTGSVMSVGFAVSSTAEAKQYKSMLDSEVNGSGYAAFLQGINERMGAISEISDEAELAKAKEAVKNSIRLRQAVIESAANNVRNTEVLKEYLGEEGFKAEIDHITEQKRTLDGILSEIEAGTYNVEERAAEAKELVNRYAQESAEGKVKKKAASYAENLLRQLGLKNADKTLQHNIELLETDVKNGVEGAAETLKFTREALASVKSYTDKDIANMLGGTIQHGNTVKVDAAVGVKLDHTMPQNAYAKYDVKTGEISINPYAVATAEAQMRQSSEYSESNMAKVKVVHEAGHAAAQADSSFVSQMYEVYSRLKAEGIVASYEVNEGSILDTYKKAGVIDSYLNTSSAKAQVQKLVQDGASTEDATNAVIDAYMQEEYVMNFLEYVEKSGGKLYESLAPEKRNVFVRAVQKIAEIFRGIAAKIRGTNVSSAKKMEDMAVRLTEAVQRFAADSLQDANTATESVDSPVVSNNTTEGENVETGNGTAAQNEDARWSLSEIHETVEEAILNRGQIDEKYNQKKISRVPERLAEMVLEASGGEINISDKYIALSGSEIYHEYKRHSDSAIESSRDQIAMTQNEITEAIAAIFDPDIVEGMFTTKDNPTQRQSFAYAKKAHGYYVVAEAVGGNRNPNIVPVMIIQVTEAKWNRYMESGKTIGEMLNENDVEMLNALDVEKNKNNRVIAAQFVSQETIANTPHSPRSNKSIAQNAENVNSENESVRWSLNNLSKDDDAYSRIYDMRVEVNKLTQSIKEFESTNDFKNAMDKLGESIANDDIDNGVKAYQQWRIDSGYGALVNKRDALRVELENAEKAFNENIANKLALEEKAAIEKSGVSEAEYFRKQAVKEFGYTPYYYDAGYITPNGKMLNFSGEKGKHFGSRGQDHRAIGVIYDDTSGTDALNRFMRDGNIRIMAESPGIDVSTVAEPTKEQYATIRRFINEYSDKGYFNVDLTDESGRVIGSLEYENRINPARVLNDIKHYFQTGEIREQSNIDKFRYSISVDSEGNKLTPEQQERFKDSKVRDENGNLKVMYHGTPNGDFTVFQDGTYFTDNKAYADLYQNPGASSISVKNGASAPKTFEVYLDIKKPFDISDPAARDIYINEYIKGGNAVGINPYLSDPTNDPDIRFSLSNSVEETKDLMALHNLHKDEVLKQIEMGGLVYPSIAITKPSKIAHDDFGDVTLILNKDAIDPKNSKYNKIYSTDAYTPTFPHISYEADSDVADNIIARVKAQFDNLHDYYQRSIRSLKDYTNLNDVLNRYGGFSGMVNNYIYDHGMKQLYLAEKGEAVPMVIDRTETEISDDLKGLYQTVVDRLGEDEIRTLNDRGYFNTLGEARMEWTKKHLDTLKDIFAEYWSSDGIMSKEEALEIADEQKLFYWYKEATAVLKYLEDGGLTVVEKENYDATNANVDEKIAGSDYKEWLNALFDGIEGQSGIRNNKDIFLPSGKRRNFKQLHDPVTVDNVIKAMRKKDQKGEGAFGIGNIYGASAKTYDSIEEAKAHSGELGVINQDEYDAIKENINGRLADIARQYANGKDIIDAKNTLVEAVAKYESKPQIAKYLKQYDYVYKYNDSIADDLISLRDYIRSLPRPYFEAKPQRAVGFDEVGVFVIPRNADVKLKQELLNRGYSIAEYDPDVEGDRQKVVNQFEEYKFSLSSDAKYAEQIESLQKLYDSKKNKNTKAANNILRRIERLKRLSGNVDADYAKRIARLKEDNTFLRAQMKAGRKTALSPTVLDNLLRDMRSAWGVSVEDNQAMKDMFRIVDNVSNSGKGMSDAVMEHLRGMAEKLLSDVYVTDYQNMRENEAFIKHIKSMTLSVPADNESDLSGGYGAYRRQNMKYVKLARNGTPVDTVYDELCNAFPGLLDRSVANPADQIDEIVAVMKSLQPVDVPAYSGMLSDASISFVNDIMAKYERGARETYSAMRDKKQQKAVDRASTAYEARIRQIEYRAAKDAEEYEAIIDRYQQKEWGGKMAQSRRDYSKSVLTNARAIRAAAVSPNQKKFIPEAYRESAKNIAQWLSDVSLFNGSITMDIANRVTADFARLSELYGEDFGSISTMLLDEVNSFANSQSEDHALKATYVMRAAAKLSHLLRRSIVNHNRIVLDGKKKSAADTGDALVRDLNTRKFAEKEFNTIDVNAKGKITAPKRPAARRATRKISLEIMDGYSFLHRMGKVGDLLFETLRSAQSKQVMYVNEYVDALERELIRTKERKDGVKLSNYIGDKQKTVTITLANNKPLTMTAAQAMNVVTLYEREAGKSHIENGGVRIVHPQNKTVSEAIALATGDVAALRSKLDAEDLRVMDVMNRFIREECTRWGNEATLERYGFHRFTTKEYFPITVDRNALPSSISAEQAKDLIQFNVQNVGFAKTADASAKAPVLIDSFIDVVNRHVEGMATYAAYLSAEDTVNRIMSAPGVRDAMQRSLGYDSIKYMNEMMTDLKGGSRNKTSILDGFFNYAASAYKSASVSLNPSTVAKQPLSYIRALAVMDAKYLIKGFHMPRTQKRQDAYKEMMQYSGIAVKKELGYSEVGVARSVGEQIGYSKSGITTIPDKASELGMKPAGHADKITWEALWIACREETLAKNSGFSMDHEAWMQATAKRFSEVVARTQVVDSPLDTAPIVRHGTHAIRSLLAFQNEPIKTFNLLMNAIDDLINTEKGSAVRRTAAKRLGTVVGVTIVGWVMEAAVSAAFSTLRDEDDDWTVFWEKWGWNTLSNAIGAVPILSSFIDIIMENWSGYDYTDMAIDVFADIIQNAQDLCTDIVDLAKGETSTRQETIIKTARDFIESVGTLFKIPVRSVFRFVGNFGKFIFHATDWYEAEFWWQSICYNPASDDAREKHEFNSLLADAYRNDREAYEWMYARLRWAGLSHDKIIGGIRKDYVAHGEEQYADVDLSKFEPGSDPWYTGLKAMFNRKISDPKATEDEITRLYLATGKTEVLPSNIKNTEEVDVDAFMEMRDYYGETLYEILNAMRQYKGYKEADNEKKAFWVQRAKDYAVSVARWHVNNSYNLGDDAKWIEEMKNERPADVAKYIVDNRKGQGW